MILRLAVVLLLGFALVAFGSRVVGTAGIWNNGVLAFISDCQTEASSVYMIDIGHLIDIRLTNQQPDRLPQWEGQQLNLIEGKLFPLVFYGASADVINTDARGFFLPTYSTEVSNIWGQAPDGRWAVVMFRDNNYEIYVTDAGNQLARRLTYNQCDDHYPRWQP